MRLAGGASRAPQGLYARSLPKLVVKLVWLALLLAFLAQLAWAECVQVERIVIGRDGSVEPPDAPVERVGSVYRLTASVCSRRGVVVEASNVVVDGGGFELVGSRLPGSAGVALAHVSNVTVRNLAVSGFYYGVRVEFSEGVRLEALNASGCAEGVSVANSSGVEVAGSRFAGNVLGVGAWFTSGFEVSGCSIGGGYWGVFVSHSPGARVLGCAISNSSWGVLLLASPRSTLAGNALEGTGFYPFESFELAVANNTVNGKPLVYLEGVEGAVVTDAGQVVVARSSRVRVVGVNASRTSVGIALIRVNGSLVENCSVTGSRWGVLLERAGGNRVLGCALAENEVGVYLYESRGNELSGNLLLSNGVGLRAVGSSGNKVWGNCFVANAAEAELAGWQGNSWDRGAGGGNYWSAHYAEDADGDGVLDEPYRIGAGNIDQYPLAACPLVLKLPEPAPSCQLRLEVNGSEVSEVELGTTVMVKAQASGALPVRAVRFEVGNFTAGWFRWDRSGGGWDALSKTWVMKLQTPGNFTVRAQVRDAGGRPGTCSAAIRVKPSPQPEAQRPAGWRGETVTAIAFFVILLAAVLVSKLRKRAKRSLRLAR
jgi:parallel beta-helix repeat protein